REMKLGRGLFSVFRQGTDSEGGGVVYGIDDEESRLNVNVADTNQLSKLPGMTPDVLAAILDWRDGDSAVSPGGAEAEYYGSLQPPYMPRNGPLQTVRELLMVRGVSQDLLFGPTNGVQPAMAPRDNSPQLKPSGGTGAQYGWANVLTVHSRVRNVTVSGNDRVNIQTADEQSLTGIKGITTDIAKAIVASRGQNQLQSIADLLDVTRQQNGGQNQRPGNGRGNQNNPGQGGGARLISETLLQDIGDDVTVSNDRNLEGAINVNTASVDVLATLPGVDRQLASQIISYRQSTGFFVNVAGLLKVPGLSKDIFKQMAPMVSARSETFRILSEGRVTSTGTRQRIEAIVRIGVSDVSTVAYREDDL
ncbi:MAG TPA: helix-hairpin-helix domain-containing protein, partial [Candidatus Limnocylindria bacterium]|nr:helix-hairpin-helix domain-containing protein [Candidatus Limnocylindria bacterium]